MNPAKFPLSSVLQKNDINHVMIIFRRFGHQESEISESESRFYNLHRSLLVKNSSLIHQRYLGTETEHNQESGPSGGDSVPYDRT